MFVTGLFALMMSGVCQCRLQIAVALRFGQIIFFWKKHLQILKFNLGVTYLFLSQAN